MYIEKFPPDAPTPPTHIKERITIMETKFCPLMKEACREDCAWFIDDPDNGGCALAVMAKAAVKAATHLDCAAYALESISANTL